MKHFHPELQESCHKHPKRTHKCEHCGKIYKRADFLSMHVAKIHKIFEKETNEKQSECSNQAQEKEKKFKCQFCSNSFTSAIYLNKHKKIIHEKRYVCQCRICNKLFIKKENLQRHIKNVHEKESFDCGSCNRSYNNEDKLKWHMAATHNKKTNLKCKLCTAPHCQRRSRRKIFELGIGSKKNCRTIAACKACSRLGAKKI
jgi:KRAB domain-containing zinc finger protein